MANKRIEVSEFGGPEVLNLVKDNVLPEPGAGEVRVKILAAGTGFTDTIIRRGQYPDVKDQPPFTLGFDWFGVIDKLGEGVTHLSEGQAVADMPVIGSYTQYLCVDTKQLVIAPDGLDPAKAVAMILSYTTAYQMLTRVRDFNVGQSILIHGAGGAVGTAMLDLAKCMGLTAYGCASSSKHLLVEKYDGIAIDYKSADFVVEIKRLTGGKGVDAVFDPIGAKNWSRSYNCLAKKGTLVVFGALQLTTGEEKLPSLVLGFLKLSVLWNLIPNGKKSVFYNIQKQREKNPQSFSQDLQSLFKLLEAGKLNPAIAGKRPLEDAIEIHHLIDRADVPGKMVLIPNPE